MSDEMVGTVKLGADGWPIRYCKDRHGNFGWVGMILPPWDRNGTYDFVSAGSRATVFTAPQSSSEGDIRAQMVAEADKGNLSVAAMRALELAELVGARSLEGAAIYIARAQVYATLNQAEVALWIKNNPR